MLTQREYLFSEDLMHLEELEARRFQHAALHTTDPEIRQLATTIAQRHLRHLSAVMAHIGQGQQVQQHQSYPQAQHHQVGNAQRMNEFGGGAAGHGGLWGDKEILTDCLVAQKNISHHYLMAADHSDDVNLLQTLMEICTDEQNIRLQIYQVMHQRGFYNPARADQQSVSQSVSKITQTLHHLQGQIGTQIGYSM